MAQFKSQHWLVVLLMSSGVALCVLILALETLTLGRIDRHEQLYDLTQDGALKIAEMHLWFEEAVSKDGNVDLDADVRQPLLSVIESVEGRVSITEPGELRTNLLNLYDELINLSAALEARWAAGATAGTAPDERFDDIYRNCLMRFKSMGKSNREETVRERSLLVRLSRGVLAVVILLFAFLAYLVYQNRRAAELRTLHLEQRVEERTVELVTLNEDLALAKDRAEEANRAKSHFLANMSHEIRTPLNAVIGTVSLLLDSKLPADQRQSLVTVQSSGRALLGLLSDVLDFSRVDVGGVELELREFDVVEVVENVLLLFAEQASQKGLELVFDRPPLLPKGVLGDGGRLRQILVNLVSNAVKFTHAGEIVVSCSVEPLADATVRLSFAVEDTGIGIPVERRDKLFRPFSQVDTSHTRVYGGTGLGLAICKELIQLMGGDLSVSSEPAKGTRFTFSVELEIVAEADEPEPERLGRILLGDTNPRVRRALRNDLQRIGYDVQLCDSLAALKAEWQTEEHAGRPYDGLFLGVSWVCSNDVVDLAGLPLNRTVLLFAMGNAHESRCIERIERVNTLAKPVSERQLRFSLRLLQSGDVAMPAPVVLEQRVQRELRVLVAEDNRINQDLVVAMLSRLGCSAGVVSDGLAAVSAVESSDYDLVLMDCQMPSLDGYQATARIRELGARGGLPIIALTAHAMRGDRERALAAGMDDYLAKPFEKDDLALVLSRWGTRFATAAAAARDKRYNNDAEASDSLSADAIVSGDGCEPDDSTCGDDPTSASECESIDRSALDRLHAMQGDTAFVSEIISIFLDETPEHIELMTRAWNRKDNVEVRKISHRLRSSCSNMGAMRLAAHLKDIEEFSTKGNVPAGLIERCQQDFAAVKEELSRLNRGRQRSDR